jgi:hypothetical protein
VKWVSPHDSLVVGIGKSPTTVVLSLSPAIFLAGSTPDLFSYLISHVARRGLLYLEKNRISYPFENKESHPLPPMPKATSRKESSKRDKYTSQAWSVPSISLAFSY